MALQIDRHKDTLIKICKELNIKRFYVFGSSLNETFSRESDVDVLISFDDSVSIEEYTENYFILHEKLEALFQRNIDVLTERTLSNPYLIESINKNKLLIYEA